MKHMFFSCHSSFEHLIIKNLQNEQFFNENVEEKTEDPHHLGEWVGGQ